MSDIFEAPEADLVQPQMAVSDYGSIDKALAGDYEFSIGAVLKEGWEKTSGAKLSIILSWVFYFLVIFAVLILSDLSRQFLLNENSMMSIQIIHSIGQQLVFNLIQAPILTGIFILGIKQSVGAMLESTSIFDNFEKMGALLVVTILISILIIIGFVLLILPGIYLFFAYFMPMQLVVDKGLSPWRAMEVSRRAITKRWFSFFFLSLILIFINIIALIPFGLGLIWSIPLTVVCYGIVYRNMFGVEAATQA